MLQTKARQLSEIAASFGATLVGRDATIHGVAALHAAHAGEISYLSNPRLAGALLTTRASAVLVRGAENLPASLTYLVCAQPALVFARIAQDFHPRPASRASIHATAVIADSAVLGPGVEIGPHVVIEEGAAIGAGAQLKAGVFVGERSTVGAGTVLMPRVVVYADCAIGERCRVHAGSIIGSDGFGNAWSGDHWERVPQIGRVIIEDDVEIGANTTIDRGALDDTHIEAGARLDNLIQIAHGVRVGRNTAIAACTGIAGSAVIGARCLIGGGVLIAGHTRLADGVTLLAGSGVPSDIDEGGVYASGTPVVPHQTWLRNMVQFKKLNELARRLRAVEKRVAAPDAVTAADSAD